MAIAEAQFSIYKINYEAVESTFNIKANKDTDEYYEEIICAIVNSISSIIKRKYDSSQQIFKCNGFDGIIFKTVHLPAWKDIADYFVENNEKNNEEIPKSFITNSNISYVFLYRNSNNLYACTGGYGSNYINKFVVKNFGLYLLPKMIKKDNQVLKNVVQNNLLGNQISSNRVNRNSTSVSAEQDMSSIFRQLTIEATRTMAEDIGLEFEDDEPDNKKVNIINKDSLVIRRSISLSELTIVLKHLSEVENKDDAFALNYMVLAKKKGLKAANLFDKMIEDFSNCDFSRFILVGDDYEQYYSYSSRYIIKDGDNNTLIDRSEPLLFSDIIALLSPKDGKITKKAISSMLRWSISTEDNAGQIVMYPTSVKDAIQGFIEYGESKIPCYLFNGSWFVFDQQYDALLTKEFCDFFDRNSQEANSIAQKWRLVHSEDSEELYNKWLAERKDIIVSHKVSCGNIELADAIFWENDTVYFMHNKHKFNGIGSRDLTNQMLVAAEYFQKNRMSTNTKDFLEAYYEKIVDAGKTYKRNIAFDKDTFVNKILSARKYVYIAGYLTGFRKETNATYAKYLCLDLKKKLNMQGFECYVISLS